MSVPRRMLLTLVAALALVAAACGGDGGDGGEGTTQQGSRNLQGQTVEVLGIWVEPEQSRFRKVLDLFEQRTGATAKYTSGGDDTPTVLGSRFEGGDPPDVAVLAQPAVVEQLATEGRLIPIDDVAADEIRANYAPVWSDLATFNGKLYGVWFKAANKSTVWYNVKAFGDAGVQPPKTWDELKQVATTLEASGVTPFSIGGADGWTLTDWFENVYIRTAGPENYDRLRRHEIPWTDESVKTAMRRLAEIWGQEGWIAGGNRGAVQTEFPTSVTQVFAAEPKAAIVYEGDFVANNITGDTEAELGTDADFFPFPSIDGSAPAVVGGGDVAVLTKDTEAGKALIEFLATPEAAEVWAGLGGYTSPNKNVDLERYADEITRKSAQQLVEATAFRFDMSDLVPGSFGARTGAGLWKLFQDFLRNPNAVDEVTRDMEAAAKRAYK